MSAIKDKLVQIHQSVAFVGMMGVGKTTVGQIIARETGLPFRDADDEIVSSAGMSIPEIFEQFQEAGFRDREYEAIQKLLSTPQVVATGGGAFAQDKTRRLLLQRAVTVWLYEDPDVVYERIKGDPNRPKVSDREAFLQLAETREQYYRQADVSVDVAGDDPQRTAQKVLSKVGEHLKL